MSDQSEWVMVPREPTQEMIKAAEQQWLVGGTNDMARREWHAMLAAAPPAPAAEPVAWADPQAFKNFKERGHLGGAHAREWMWAKPDIGLVPLYTAPPPVSVDAEPVLWVYQFGDKIVSTNSADIAKRMAKVLGVAARPLIYGDIAPPPVEASQQHCPCGDREASKCPGEWEPGCDLGANEMFARRVDEASQQQAEGDCTWEHAANEWADVATNAVTVLENVRDGITSFEDAIASFKSWYESARAAQPGTEKQAEPASRRVSDER